MSKAILVFDSYETLKKQYGKKVLITINIPVEGKKGIRGYQYHSTEDAILKPMPEKIEIPPIPKGILKTVWEKEKRKREGWNMCVEEILGEDDEID